MLGLLVPRKIGGIGSNSVAPPEGKDYIPLIYTGTNWEMDYATETHLWFGNQKQPLNLPEKTIFKNKSIESIATACYCGILYILLLNLTSIFWTLSPDVTMIHL